MQAGNLSRNLCLSQIKTKIDFISNSRWRRTSSSSQVNYVITHDGRDFSSFSTSSSFCIELALKLLV